MFQIGDLMAKPKISRQRGAGGAKTSIGEGDSPDTPVEVSTTPNMEDDLPGPAPGFPIVGVGASAGGLEAFTHLLKNLPATTGMGFVFIQHLAPQHPSMLASILSRATTMPVLEAIHGTLVRPNHVYVIPPNKLLSLGDTRLQLAPRSDERGAPRTIDHFFRSLAVERKTAAIGVLLSGTDADGTAGLQAICGEGGIAIAQSEESAKHPEMPRFAIAAGVADLILSPQEIALELDRIARHPSLNGREPRSIPKDDQAEESRLGRIFTVLRAATKVDFRGYKPGSIRRRIARRMILQGYPDLETYVAQLEANAAEVLALYEDILINVTGFFRDPETFEALEKEILPKLLRNRPMDLPVRVWVGGCSTGEEVYSIAMCLSETIAAIAMPISIQIFGTDISERSIRTARAAIYSDAQVAKLSPERQARFFIPVANGHQVVKAIREVCVFARQNLFVDPPFARLDLVSCRNVLIYLGPALQRHVIATFHFALQPHGYLMLGRSETLLDSPDFFSLSNKVHKFYERKATHADVSVELMGRGFAQEQPRRPVPAPFGAKDRAVDGELEKTAERIVLSEYGPAWVVVNKSLDIIHSRGDTSPYLQLAPGRATFALLKMAREGLRGELRKLLARAKSEPGPVQSPVLQEKHGEQIRRIRMEVRRMDGAAAQTSSFLVLFFASRNAAIAPKQNKIARDSASGSERLKRELALTSQRLQSIIDERDAANQDLTTANEEIQSSNEELQSINEELETSKEELQAGNEELNTVNDELQNRNHELSRLTDDLANLLSSAAMPILMLDNELRIRRITPPTERLLNIRSSDIGRPIGDIRMRLSMDDLEPMIRRVIETLIPEEIEIQDREETWHALRIRPYRTADNRIEGAVLVLVDIDQVRRARMAANAARAFAESVVESVETPLLVLHGDLRVRMTNRAFLQFYRLQPEDVENRVLFEINGEQWNLPGLRTALAQLSAGQPAIDDLEVEQEVAGLGRRTLLIKTRALQPDDDRQILAAIEDITVRRSAQRVLVDESERLKRSVQVGAADLEHAETALHESQSALLRNRGELRALTASLLHSQEEERRRVSRELHDELSQKMAKLQFDIETLEQQAPAGQKRLKENLQAVRDKVAAVSNDVRRIAYQLHPSTLDHLGLSVALRSFSREFSEREGIQVQFTARKVPVKLLPEVASSLYRVTQEALRNVAKHAGKAAVKIVLTGNADRLNLSIQDEGPGFDTSAMQGNGGLGLISMQERVRLVHGQFTMNTRPGHGVHILIQVPLRVEEEANASTITAGG